MKKIALLVASIVLLSACKKAPMPTSNESAPTSAEIDAQAEMSVIAKAMESGQPVSCSIEKEDGTSSMKYAMKGKKIKVTGIAAMESATDGVVLSDGEYLYSWDPATKKGIKMQARAMDATPAPGDTQEKQFPTIQSPEDVEQYQNDGYNVNCEVTTVPDSEFVPPTDVEFTDLSAALKQVPMKATEGQSSEAMEKQVQEMMKQYQEQ